MHSLNLRTLITLLPAITAVYGVGPKAKDFSKHDYYAVHLSPNTSPETFAQGFGVEYVEPLGMLEDHYIFKTPINKGIDVVQTHLERLRKRDMSIQERELHNSVLFFDKQKLKKLHKRVIPPRNLRDDVLEDGGRPSSTRPAIGVHPVPPNYRQSIMKTLDIVDPIFKDQWHLLNTVQNGNDVNVTGVWLEGRHIAAIPQDHINNMLGYTGKNATVAIVDDGLDFDSLDLKDNYFAAGSWDYNDPGPDPKPRLSDDRHGTRCAGEVAAVRNDVCGVGVAYDAKVAGIRILSKLISDSDESDALNYKWDENHIYSCSWGPTDDGMTMEAPSILIKRSIQNGVQKGRSGKGSIFVFASGNGANSGDNCNFDGYTNSIYSITVTAIDREGNHPYYAESCSANLVVTYSSGGSDGIHTTDVGTNQCYGQHGGTSAAAPLAAGIYALVLSARPDLTWRDLQYLSVNTAVPVNVDDPDWVTTTIGKKFNHKYGYGKLDAYALVHAAKDHVLVKPQAWFHTPKIKVNSRIPDGEAGITSEFEVTSKMLKEANLGRLEHVTVTMNAKHSRRGDMAVDLISPNGIVSKIATARPRDSSKSGYIDWTFMSVKHWGEDGIGKWKILVYDTVHPEETGKFIDWQLNLWGESIDASIQGLHPLPGSNNTDPHGIPISTTTGSAATTRLSLSSDRASHTSNPDDHPSRPGKAKPTDEPSTTQTSSDAMTTSHADQENAPTGTSATMTGSSTTASSLTTSTSEADSEKERPNFIPSFFPTFGVSAKKQVWFYGAFVVIVLFISGLGAYLCVQKRKLQKNKDSMNDYEFAMLENDGDVETGDQLLGGKNGKKGSKKGRDLYDAFGASDDEDAAFSSEDEDNEHKYRADDKSDDDDSDQEQSSGSYQDIADEKEGDASGSRRGRLLGKTV